MADTPTWRSAAREAARLCPADEEALELIGRLPLVPISQLLPLSGGRSGRSGYACVERLAERGLVSVIPGPGHLGKPHRRLLLISNLGLAALAWRHEVDHASLARAWRLGRTPLRVLVGQLPALLSLYALLGLLAATGRGRARLTQWSRPGRWRPRWDGAGTARSVTLPAYAALGWEEAGSAYVDGRYLLVADTGSLTPAALRRQLAGLARLDGTTPYAVPTVVIATTSERRVRAWTILLDSVTSSRRSANQLHVEVATWESWAARAGMDPPRSRLAPDRADADSVRSAALPRSDFERECRPWGCVPRPINPSHIAAALGEWSLAPRDRIVLDILGRHPFLADEALAGVLGRTGGWAP